MFEISVEAGTTLQQKEKAQQYLDMWQEFSNSAFVRTASENLRSPENIETAIRGATVLMSAEPRREFQEDVRKMIDALEKRYGR